MFQVPKSGIGWRKKKNGSKQFSLEQRKGNGGVDDGGPNERANAGSEGSEKSRGTLGKSARRGVEVSKKSDTSRKGSFSKKTAPSRKAPEGRVEG